MVLAPLLLEMLALVDKDSFHREFSVLWMAAFHTILHKMGRQDAWQASREVEKAGSHAHGTR